MTARLEQLVKRTFIDFRQTLDFLANPIVIERASGLFYWDTNNKRYFDGIGGIFVVGLGHGNERTLQAMRKQMDVITFAPPLHSISRVSLDYIEALGQHTPGNLKFIKPFSGGSEAVESALKFTRQYHKQTGNPNKFKFVSRYLAYHGATFGGMAASGNGTRKSKFEPHVPGFVKVFPPSHYRDRFSTWEEANRFAAQSFEDVIIAEDPDTVAGVIVEPIGNTGGIITPTEEYFKMIRDVCDRHNVTMILDEVITGFGKTGHLFASQTFGVAPDIIVAGKALSNGVLPMGAMIARQDMADKFLGSNEDNVHFAHGHTFAGNPLAAAVGMAVLQETVDHNLPARAQTMGKLLRQKLQAINDRLGVFREVRGRGLLLGVELWTDPVTKRQFPDLGNALKHTALRNGLIMRIDPTWFALCPAMTASEEEIQLLADLVEKSVVDALDAVAKARRDA
eukprot:TRINITY_DN5320_c0_g1_i1.p2 TRINITY_DN5320_c0_g1~~TRINITY_DN5320_c0_g1_i1.p2  ORF type:complete len:452 (+),score=109.81 TRINITY_DN5320_c0_g1_i1:1-1356(+)